jgi:hypothetical protein
MHACLASTQTPVKQAHEGAVSLWCVIACVHTVDGEFDGRNTVRGDAHRQQFFVVLSGVSPNDARLCLRVNKIETKVIQN